jgi:hypothetical protein
VASMGAMKLGLSPAACPGIAVPRACRPRACPGSRLDGHGVLTWQYLPRPGQVHTGTGSPQPTPLLRASARGRARIAARRHLPGCGHPDGVCGVSTWVA